MREMECTFPEQTLPVKFNYWDYIESFNEAFFKNSNRKHSWFIKICSNVFKQKY